MKIKYDNYLELAAWCMLGFCASFLTLFALSGWLFLFMRAPLPMLILFVLAAGLASFLFLTGRGKIPPI